MIDPVRSAILDSKVYALATGTEDRYAAMHAPPPRMVHAATEVDAAKLIRALHPLRPQLRHGTRVDFAMPARSELQHKRLDPLAMRRSTVSPNVAPTSAALIEPLRSIVEGAPPHGLRPVARPQGGRVKPALAGGTGTGIEHWWTYEERAIPGIGKAMANVGTGNFMVSALDVDVPEQGIDLAFQRVYNSQSLHDYNGDDGGDPAIFGNRWTNNFDANIVYNPNGSGGPTITVYDLDGAACTYTSDAHGNWVPCTGQYATLKPTDGTDCTYALTKKNGTVYWFRADVGGPPCNIQQAKQGHIVEILARNQNNTITLAYSYNGSGFSSEDVTEIDADHSDGQKLMMLFGLIPGTSKNELGVITRPDQAKVYYSYDSSGNLVEVDKPGNNSASSVPDGHGVKTGYVPETYVYATGTSTMTEACGPRCTVGVWNNSNNPTDGASLLFASDGALRLKNWTVNGMLNFTPDDGTGALLQLNVTTAYQPWYTEYFDYGPGSDCSGTGSGTTTMCDSDGHNTIWTLNSSNQVIQTQNWAGTAENLWIVTSQAWDTSNNLISTTDANGNKTKYGYDTPGVVNQGGNLVEMQQPQLSDVSGSPTPLSTYSYDPFNNITAYCDPVYNGSGTWMPVGDGLCSSVSGAARFTYSSTSNNILDPNEPNGCLIAIKKPGGYNTAISYPSSPGYCGKGLPTETQGDTINQWDPNNATRTPIQDFSYDGFGNLSTYDKGPDGHGKLLDAWTLNYDGENELNQKTEHDSPIGLTGSSFGCYYPDGSLFYTETPSQHDADGDPPCPSTVPSGSLTAPSLATAYYYDLDGDQVKVITHKGCGGTEPGCPGPSSTTACVHGETNPIGTTCKYYDGLDRLVETIEPYDSGQYRNFNSGATKFEYYSNPVFRWMNRYIYDLSQGSGQLSIADNTGSISGLVAYGNLYKTQEYLPKTKLQTLEQSPDQPAWYDVRGTSFDGMDRPVGKYELAYGTTAVTLNSYDCTNQLDLLCSTTNAVGQKTSYTYDAIRRVQETAFSGTQPRADTRFYTFDADGRTASAQNSMGTLNYTYDVDGNEQTVTEPNQEPIQPNGASLICYDYYGDGLREYLSIGPADVGGCTKITQNLQPANGGISQPKIFSYAYQADGLLVTQQVNWSAQETFQWTYSLSGRELTENDPLTGKTVSFPPQTGIQPVQLDAKSYGYDNYGRVNHLTFPGGYQLSGHTYDDDDELTAYKIGTQNQITRNFTLNARGEMLEDSLSNPGIGYAQGPTQSANGAQVGNGDTQVGGGTLEAPPTTLQFDARTNQATCSPNPQWAQGITGDQNYTYDAAGRQTGAGASPNGEGCIGANATNVTTYDAENHIQTTQNPWAMTDGSGNPVFGTGTVLWGPDGRHRADEVAVNGNTTINTAHWDGDTMLFEAYGPNNATLYVGKLGLMHSSGDILIADRDQTGTQLTTHAYTAGHPTWAPNGLWYSGLTLGSVRHLYSVKSGQPPTIQPATGSCGFSYGSPPTPYDCPKTFDGAFPMTRSDGYGMIGGLVQGARTYDPTSGQWLTPDAYAGDVRDPMSQKPFMWNSNNPVEWSDPSGYCTIVIVDCVAEGIAALGAAAGSAVATGGLVAGIMGLTTARTAPGTLSQRERAQQIRGALFAAEHGGGEERENGTNPADDKKASKGEIERIEELTGESIEETKTGGSHAGGTIIVRDTEGNYYVKPASGKGPGEPLGINRGELPKTKSPNKS